MRLIHALATVRSLWKVKYSRARIPVFVGYSITNRCNQECLYCSKTLLTGPELTTQETLDLIDQLADAGTKFLTLTGGEPLLREDLGTILDRLQHHGITVTLNTNGSLVPQRKELLSLVNSLSLSLDGKPESNQLRGIGTYEQVMEAVALAQQRNCKLVFSSVIHSRNVHRLSEMIAIARQCKTIVTFQPVSSYLNGGQYIAADILPEKSAFKAAIERIIEDPSCHRFIGNSLSSLTYYLQYPYKTYTNCQTWRFYCRIEPDGFISVCGRQFPKLNTYSIRQYRLIDAFLRFTPVTCYGCWCGNMLNLNQLIKLEQHTVVTAIRRVLWNM